MTRHVGMVRSGDETISGTSEVAHGAGRCPAHARGSLSANLTGWLWWCVIPVIVVTSALFSHVNAAPLAQSSVHAPATRGWTNVLFLMTDEQHYRSLSINGNPYITTPNMDRVGREGVCFTNATCVTPYCSPSRASILTGVYPHRHRILMNVSPGRNQQPPLRQDAFANTETMLHRAGYFTAHRGKWHLGNPGNFDCYESFGYATKTPRGYRQLLDQRLPAAQFADDPSPGR